MFQFLKTKKGFSLVELMIVVVIMAILVAVAVPIYNSISDNTRAKTCVSNQRQLYSSVNNHLTAFQVSGEAGTIVIKTDSDDKGVFDSYTGISEKLYNDVKGLFNIVPCCPVSAGGELNVVFILDSEGFSRAYTRCVNGDEAHVFVDEED